MDQVLKNIWHVFHRHGFNTCKSKTLQGYNYSMQVKISIFGLFHFWTDERKTCFHVPTLSEYKLISMVIAFEFHCVFCHQVCLPLNSFLQTCNLQLFFFFFVEKKKHHFLFPSLMDMNTLSRNFFPFRVDPFLAVDRSTEKPTVSPKGCLLCQKIAYILPSVFIHLNEKWNILHRNITYYLVNCTFAIFAH